jgi:hypothetical protein
MISPKLFLFIERVVAAEMAIVVQPISEDGNYD